MRDAEAFGLSLKIASALRQKAEANDPKAALILGLLYMKGQGGVAKDPATAREWFRKAAEADNATAQVVLGLIYLKGGFGVDKDETTAVHWIEQAAAKEDPSGLFYFALLHINGQGVVRNFKKGIDLLKQSAALDYAKAQVLLGTMLHAGTDVPRDSKRAKAWARRAAEQDEPKGAALLGVLLAQQQRYGELQQQRYQRRPQHRGTNGDGGGVFFVFSLQLGAWGYHLKN